MRIVKINNVKIPKKVKEFAFDGCHKIYLMVGGEQAKQFFKDKGWDDSDFHPISELEDTFNDSCPLRFINWDDTRGLGTVVPQCEEETIFEYDNGEKHILRF